MNVLVLSNMMPFVHGGAEELCSHLVRQLNAAGTSAEAFRIPFAWEPYERLVEEMVIARSLRLWGVDRVIALKFPAYMIPHDNKVLWLLHQYRQAYDLFDAKQSNIPDNRRGDEIRAMIKAGDNACFRSARAIFSNSAVTAERLRRYNGFDSEILLPPLNDPELFTGGESQRYILASGRINSGKRQSLLIEALRYCPPNVHLIVAGPPDSAEDAQTITRLAGSKDRVGRVDLRLEFLPRAELATLVNQALAVAYLPFDEDSPGYVVMEALNAAKPVLTTTDSGGVLQLIHHELTGMVIDPNPKALARAMTGMTNDPARSRRWGREGQALWRSLGINWKHTLERLLS